MVGYKRLSLLDRKFVKSDLFEHLLIETGKTAWLPFKAGLSKFPWKRKSQKL